MQCPVCKREMRPLFISFVCDYCDGLCDAEYDRGWVVFRPRTLPVEEYVFRTRRDAERWRDLRGFTDATIREVLCEERFHWQSSRGTVTGIELADHLYQIFPDHRFEPGPYRAFLSN